MHFLNENVRIVLKISLKFVPKVPIHNILSLVQILAWHRQSQHCPSGSEPNMKYDWMALNHNEKRSQLRTVCIHSVGVIIGTIASQITSLTIVYSTVYSDADQRKHQSSASLAFVWGIHRGPVNSPHKWPVTRKMFPFDDVIMVSEAIILRIVSNVSSMKYSIHIISRATTSMGDNRPSIQCVSYIMQLWFTVIAVVYNN